MHKIHQRMFRKWPELQNVLFNLNPSELIIEPISDKNIGSIVSYENKDNNRTLGIITSILCQGQNNKFYTVYPLGCLASNKSFFCKNHREMPKILKLLECNIEIITGDKLTYHSGYFSLEQFLDFLKSLEVGVFKSDNYFEFLLRNESASEQELIDLENKRKRQKEKDLFYKLSALKPIKIDI